MTNSRQQSRHIDSPETRETRSDTEQRRMTDRGTDVGTSEPGVPPRSDHYHVRERVERKERERRWRRA